MRIAIDARELTGRATGVGRYLARLLQQWQSIPTGHEFLLYAHRAIDSSMAVGFPARILAGAGGTLWEQLTFARAIASDKPDVLFAPAYTAPLGCRIPRVVTIHDVSFVAHPEWFHRREGMRRRFVTARSARIARTVITVSEFSRREIEKRLGIERRKIRVIFHGIDHPTAEPPTRAGMPPKILYVGSIFNRRHVPDLVAAVALLAQTHPAISLDLVGDDRTFPAVDVSAVIARHAPATIRWHRYVSDADLYRLYREARAFAFLSEYEGFGLTPLEALARGVPSVLYDTPISHESCGDAALYVPMNDIEAIAGALGAVLFDEQIRDRLRTNAHAVLGRYAWSTAATETLATIEGAA